LKILIKKIIEKISDVNSVQLLVIRTPDLVLGPDPDRYSAKMLDPDPATMSPDPKHCSKIKLGFACNKKPRSYDFKC
jgi:hypothetical protein